MVVVYSERGLWADQRLVLCRRAASSSKPFSSLTSYPNTLMGYNKLQLKFLCCWSWPLSCSPNEVLWCTPRTHSLLFSILFAMLALTSGLEKNVFSYNTSLGCQFFFSPIVALESCHPETSPAQKQLVGGELGQRVFHTNDECTSLAPALWSPPTGAIWEQRGWEKMRFVCVGEIIS